MKSSPLLSDDESNFQTWDDFSDGELRLGWHGIRTSIITTRKEFCNSKWETGLL